MKLANPCRSIKAPVASNSSIRASSRARYRRCNIPPRRCIQATPVAAQQLRLLRCRFLRRRPVHAAPPSRRRPRNLHHSGPQTEVRIGPLFVSFRKSAKGIHPQMRRCEFLVWRCHSRHFHRRWPLATTPNPAVDHGEDFKRTAANSLASKASRWLGIISARIWRYTRKCGHGEMRDA